MRKRFLPPIGTLEERLSGKIWPGKWIDATGYGRNTVSGYTLGYHTGFDGNLNDPTFNADKGKPVYAIAPGVVTYARIGPGTWGLLVVVDHGIADGLPLFTRTAHGTNLGVQVGQQVDEWTRLCDVSNAEGQFADHLHFDICYTNILKTQPWHWPGWNLALLESNYRDPKQWLMEEHEVEGDDMPDNLIIKAANGSQLLPDLPFASGTPVVADERIVVGAIAYRKVDIGGRVGWMPEADLGSPTPILEMYANAPNGLNIRSQPTTTANPPLGTIPLGTKVRVQDTGIVANTYTWVKLVDQPGYVAKELLRANP